jgi:dolichyl-phosphate beta-glucosyltransferase
LPEFFLSIIFPAHNEETRLPATLEKVAAFIIANSYPIEVLVVENGSNDRTFSIAQEFQATIPNLRVIHEDQSGKGLAVKRGMLEATGEYRFVCDVDLSMPLEEINNFIPPKLTGVDVGIGSREAPGAHRYNEPVYRHLVGRAFNNMVRWIVLPGLNDTQCGFKCFSAAAAKEVFSRQTIPGWTFDVEVLYIARRLGYKVVEVPIHWYHFPGSKIRVLKDSLHMAMDLFKIRLNGLKGLYR